MTEPAAVAAFEVPGYTVGERIGAGGFGEVYRATHALMGREVAIKVLNAKYSAHPEAVARFVSEARAVARISHPGIVDVFDFGQLPDGRQYCVMELVKGTTLRDLLREKTRLPLADALPILRGIAEAIDAAHAAGIAHRDLKPDNVFVLDGGGVKLIDFGLAKLTSEDAPVTETGSVFGTPLYMSPEQCRGKATDTRTDAYSFGVLAYHVLVGTPPFTGEALEIALHHLNDPPPPAGVSEAADRAIAALMAKDPAARPMPLATAIAAIAGDIDLPAVAAPRASRRWLALGLGAAATAGIVAVVVSRTQRSPDATAAAASCTPAAARLAGIWDSPRRAAVEARFSAVNRPDIPGTWRALSSELDGYAAQWSTQWDAACTKDAGDPVLHAQREACLEAALADLAGAVKALGSVDAAAFATSWPGALQHATLASCTIEATLRAQPQGPPAENRDKVIDGIAQVYAARFRAEAAIAADAPLEAVKAADQLEPIANQLDELRAPAANAARWHRAFFLARLAQDDPGRRDAARSAIDQAVTRADATRDDLWLVYDHALRTLLEVDAGALDAADQAKARADAAMNRSGLAPQPLRFLKLVAARHAAAHGEVGKALDRFAALPPPDFGGADTEVADHAVLLRRAGKLPDAVELLRAEVAARAARYGEQHVLTAEARMTFAAELDQVGDAKGALDQIDRALAIHRALGLAPRRDKALRTLQLDIAVRAGRNDLVEDAARGSVRDGGDAPISAAEWLAVTQRAIDRGSVDTARLSVDRIPADAGAVVPMRDDLSAIIAAIDGDVDRLERDAHDPAVPLTERSQPAEIRISIWLRGLAELARGNRAATEARLARLAPVHAIKSPDAAGKYLLGDGVLLAALGRFRDAAALFAQARGGANLQRAHQLAALDAWLGVTRVQAGDLRAAIPPLEEALDIFARCCGGTSWLAPGAEYALARALWETGRDRVRARALAEAARAHSVRLRARRNLVFPELVTATAERWLAEHTAEDARRPILSTTGCPAPKDPKARGTHTLYVAAEGVTITHAQVTDARRNQSTMPPADVVVPPFLDGVPERRARLAAIVAIAQEILAPYSIDVVLERPTSGDYRMTVLGGTPALLQMQPGIASTSPFDCTASTPNNVNFAFDYGTKPKDAEYARTLVSDLGAMLGLAGVQEPGDCMCRGGRVCEQFVERCTFGAGGAVPVAPPTCNRPEQDEGAMLKAALGCR